jgi:hypothetical protein
MAALLHRLTHEPGTDQQHGGSSQLPFEAEPGPSTTPRRPAATAAAEPGAAPGLNEPAAAQAREAAGQPDAGGGPAAAPLWPDEAAGQPEARPSGKENLTRQASSPPALPHESPDWQAPALVLPLGLRAVVCGDLDLRALINDVVDSLG